MFPSNSDFLPRNILWLSCLSSSVIFIGILGFLAFSSWDFFNSSLQGNLSLFEGWQPQENQFNFLPMVIGSFAVAVGSVLVLIPWSFASLLALHLHLPSRFLTMSRLLLILMAGMPTVVIGLWGLETMVPLLNKILAPGTGLLCGILVLTLMTYPSTMIMLLDRLEQIPQGLRTTSESLGLSKRSYLLEVALPSIKPHLAAIYLLAMTRAAGETIAVVLVAGNVVQIPSHLSSAFRSLTANIVLEMPYAMGVHKSSLFFSGLLLTLTCFVLIWTANHLIKKSRHD